MKSSLPSSKPASASPYLEPSSSESDGGELVGKLPSRVSLEDLRALGNPDIRSKAIRAKCIDCSGGNRAEVRKCVAVNCALWAFRMGPSPFRYLPSQNSSDEAEPPEN